MAKAKSRMSPKPKNSRKNRATNELSARTKAKSKLSKKVVTANLASHSQTSLQLHINSSGHWLVDTTLGGVQVGEAHQESDGSWLITFGDNLVEASDLDSALQLVANEYDPSRIKVGPMSDSANWDNECDEDVEIIDLPPRNVSSS